MTLRKRMHAPSAKSALTGATQTPENTGNTGVLMLSIAPQITVQNANAPGAGNTTTRSDQDEHVRGVVMANAHPIFAHGFCRNPVSGSVRP
jgi:hypothetical protein